MLPKSKIRLSRSLRAQTTPYPEAGRWLRRGIILFTLTLAFGIYLAARPESRQGSDLPAPPADQEKQILGAEAPGAEYITYEIKKGDTLFNLASRYGVSWQTLAELNSLKEPYLLKIGQKIKIPSK